MQTGSLTRGPITPTLLRFALPMMLGNLLQQLYNIADTLIVGRYVGADALAAVGSAYTLMTFLTSILLGCPWAAAWRSPSPSAGEIPPACAGRSSSPSCWWAAPPWC